MASSEIDVPSNSHNTQSMHANANSNGNSNAPNLYLHAWIVCCVNLREHQFLRTPLKDLEVVRRKLKEKEDSRENI